MIEDIGQVINDESPQGNSGHAKLVTAEIISIVNIDQYKSCHNCSAKLSHSVNCLPKMQCQNENSQVSKPKNVKYYLRR